jgi:hypothetical protein
MTALSDSVEEIRSLRAQLAVATKVIEPFAEEAKKWKNIRNVNMRPICAKPEDCDGAEVDEAALTVADLRALLAFALNPQSAGNKILAVIEAARKVREAVVITKKASINDELEELFRTLKAVAALDGQAAGL